MPRYRVCCICGESDRYSRKNSVSFFTFPKKDGRLCNVDGIQLTERRIVAWKKVVGRNYNKYYGTQTVCSKHFHSGKPSYLFLENDVDWVPSKNLENLQQDKESDINSMAYFSSSNSSNEDGGEINCVLNVASAEYDSSDVKALLNTRTTAKETTGCCIDPTRPMGTIVNPELLFNPFSENPSTAVQCALDDKSITVKQELMDIEDFEDKACAPDDKNISVKKEIMNIEDFEDKTPLNIDPNFNDSLNSTSTAECGTQVDFDEPPRPIQSDKSTQTQMSSFPKSHEIQKSKEKKINVMLREKL